MAEIIPDSTITLLFDVPLQNNYENTFYFISLNEQRNWFFNYYRKVEFNQQSYQRKNKGWLRLSARYRDVYNANYMYFMNNWRTQTPSVPEMVYEQKDFYAFITQVDYINDMTVEIHYEIDVLQTYMFDWQFQDTFIERETVESDNVGEHIIDEGLPIGDYVNNETDDFTFYSRGSAFHLNEKYYMLAASFNYDPTTDTFTDLTDGVPTNQIVNGIPVGCKFRFMASANEMLQFLDKIPGEKINGVISLNIVPKLAYEAYIASQSGAASFTAVIDRNLYQGSNHPLDGYIPENNKLQCYPYNFLMLQGSDGASQTYCFEHFPSEMLNFNLVIIAALPVQGFIAPVGYKKGQGANHSLEMPYAIYIPPTATCTFSTDTFKAWYALNSGFISNSIASSAVDAVGDIAKGAINLLLGGGLANAGVASAGISNLTGLFHEGINISNTLLTVENAKKVPDAYNGSAQNQLLMAGEKYNIWYVNRCIRSDYAKSLDKYFKMFGYKVNTVKHPYLTNRTRFTYLKTLNMDIGGDIPTDDKNKICEIFNKGIRWWLDIATIGDYTSPNPVRSA